MQKSLTFQGLKVEYLNTICMKIIHCFTNCSIVNIYFEKTEW